MVTLRKDQTDLIEEVADRYRNGQRSVLAQAPTGFGKTTTASVLIRRALEKNKRVLFTAHLNAILSDTMDRLDEDLPGKVGRIQAGYPMNLDLPVQVGSIHTLLSRKLFPPADLVIIDEAHHGVSSGYKEFISNYPNSRILGLTATPERSDGQPLGDIFESLVQGPTNKYLVSIGVLVPAVVFAPNQMKNCLSMDPYEAWRKYSKNRQSAFFMSNLKDAQELHCKIGNSVLYTSETSDEDRRRIKRGIQSGEIRDLITVNAILEGFDATALDCIFLCRGFSSVSSMLQAIGRGLRACHLKEKKDCLVIDLVGSVLNFGLPEQERIWSINGKSAAHIVTETKLCICDQCGAFFEGLKQCPRCNSSKESVRVEKKMKIKFSELELVTPHRAMLGQAQRYVNNAISRMLFHKMRYEAAVNKLKKTSPIWVKRCMVELKNWKPEDCGIEDRFKDGKWIEIDENISAIKMNGKKDSNQDT